MVGSCVLNPEKWFSRYDTREQPSDPSDREVCRYVEEDKFLLVISGIDALACVSVCYGTLWFPNSSWSI